MRHFQPLCQKSRVIIIGKAACSDGMAATWSTQFCSTADVIDLVPVWANISSLILWMKPILPCSAASHGGTAGYST